METNYKKTMIWKNVTRKRKNDLLTKSDKFKDVKLIIKGPLYLYDYTSLASLPEGLQVEGSLGLSGCPNLTSLPEGLQVEGTLRLSECTNLRSLPEGLQVGYLNLTSCPSLTSLPNGLKVERGLQLEACTNLKSLPEGLKVEGGLYLVNTPLAKYTDGELLKMIGSNGYIKGIIKRHIFVQ